MAPADDLHPDEDRPVFLLGTGCQKGGTAWLHDYLGSSAETDLGFMKEYHVWDRLDLDEDLPGLKRVLKRGRTALDTLATGGRSADVRALRQATFMLDPDSYFDYFASLVGPGRARLTGDLTPAYGGLGAPRLAMLREGVERRGLQMRVLMSLRDPVERIWSAVRMMQMRQPSRYPGGSADWVRRLHAGDEVAARTRYDLTLARVCEALPADQVHVVLYETLFEPASLAALTADLGLSPIEPDTESRPNQTPRTTEVLPDELVAQVARHYRDVYEGIDQAYPHLDVRSRWASARFL